MAEQCLNTSQYRNAPSWAIAALAHRGWPPCGWVIAEGHAFPRVRSKPARPVPSASSSARPLADVPENREETESSSSSDEDLVLIRSDDPDD